MQNKVRKALRKAIAREMKQRGANWLIMYNIGIKKEWGIPVGASTIYKIAEKDDYNTMSRNKLIALLDYYAIPWVNEFGVINLAKK